MSLCLVVMLCVFLLSPIMMCTIYSCSEFYLKKCLPLKQRQNKLVCLSLASLSGLVSNLQWALGFSLKHYTLLENLIRIKHSSLFCPFVRYDKSFYNNKTINKWYDVSSSLTRWQNKFECLTLANLFQIDALIFGILFSAIGF